MILLFLLMILSGASSLRFIDKRVQIKMKESQEEDKTSLIILFNDFQDEELKEEIKKHDGTIKYKLDIIKAYAIELPCKNIKKLAKHPKVDFIADDAKLSTLLDIARPTIGGEIADEYNLTGKGIGIATLDTGVYPHADLTLVKNRIIGFKDFVKDKKFPYDDNGHGTHVAGIAAGNGYSSKGKYRGIAPNANIIAVKVMDELGSGSTSDIVAGMQWIFNNKRRYNIRITSISLGSDPDLSDTEDPLVKGVEALWDAGIVVVTAAGNAGPKRKTINSPGISERVITVGATDDHNTINIKDDTIAKFSSRGPANNNVVKPDIVAPGVNITSLRSDIEFIPENNRKKYKFKTMEEPYTEMSGTSMATPMVSGGIALLLEKEPKLTPNEIKKKLMNTAISLKENRYAQGKGQISLKNFL